MSFTSSHNFRSFYLIINSLTFTSSFLGGPSSVKKKPTFNLFEEEKKTHFIENENPAVGWNKYRTSLFGRCSTNNSQSKQTARFRSRQNRTHHSTCNASYYSEFICVQFSFNELFTSSFACSPCALGFVELIRDFLEFFFFVWIYLGMDTVLIDYCPRKALPLANIIRYFLSTSAFAGLW